VASPLIPEPRRPMTAQQRANYDYWVQEMLSLAMGTNEEVDVPIAAMIQKQEQNEYEVKKKEKVKKRSRKGAFRNFVRRVRKVLSTKPIRNTRQESEKFEL